MISERIHAMIGAVGVATPFLCLGSKTDRRIKGILSELVGCGEQIVYMNDPDLNNTFIRCFNKAYSNRIEIASSRTDSWTCSCGDA